jgi:hypothetical protein
MRKTNFMRYSCIPDAQGRPFSIAQTLQIANKVLIKKEKGDYVALCRIL